MSSDLIRLLDNSYDQTVGEHHPVFGVVLSL